MANNPRLNGDGVVEHLKDKATSDPSSTFKRRISVRDADAESAFEEKGLAVRESDFKKRQVFKGWTLFWLAYQSTGVIYGDIGTSPLYVYSSTFSSAPDRRDLLGALSLIIWTLTIIVTVKYVLIVLRADDEGEGGTFAIYTLLSRFCNILKRDLRGQNTVKMERYATNDLGPGNRGVRSWLEQSKIAHGFLKVLAVFGVSLIMADGILTPAQSVLGAIQGLEVVKPDIGKGTIIGASCGILILLYLVQPLGIHRISSAFAPVVIIWLLFNACSGIYNLSMFDYTVLKAFSPYFAGDWFVRNKTDGWLSLGGILLAFTGVEALFADLGAFSRRAIQISWLFLAYPCLLLAYIGQAAYLSTHPDAYDNPFFKTVPPGSFYPALVISILAAIVASQALITSTFQLLSQIMHGSYFPHIQMTYTSEKFHGQVYIPMANWLMMIGTVIVTAVYNNTTSLGHAYGFCVILVTFITTNLVTLVAIIVWRIHPALVLTVWLPFALFDGLYFTSACTKIPNGAWFTLLLAIILSSFFTLWRYGKEKQWSCEARDRMQISSLITKSSSTEQGSSKASLALSDRFGGGVLTEIDGMGIFFDKTGDFVPMVYEHWLRKFRAQMGVVVLMHMRALSVPRVAEEDRFAVAQTSVRNVYRLVIRHGYNDHVITPDLARLVYEELRRAIVDRAVRPSDTPPDDRDTIAVANAAATSASTGMAGDPRAIDRAVESHDSAIAQKLRHLDQSFETQALYIVGKEQMRIDSRYNLVKKMVLETFLWVRENSRGRVEKLNVPVDKLVEVGFVGEI